MRYAFRDQTVGRSDCNEAHGSSVQKKQPNLHDGPPLLCFFLPMGQSRLRIGTLEKLGDGSKRGAKYQVVNELETCVHKYIQLQHPLLPRAGCM